MEKIKSYIESDMGKNLLILLIVILVSTGSFFLGRLSKQSENKGVKIEYPAPLQAQPGNIISSLESSIPVAKPKVSITKTETNRGYVASKRGRKYYPVGCPAAENLKVENRIYFKTAGEATEAGYTASSSCD